MEKEVINVALYGDGSRLTPLYAEYTSCCRANECSLYAQGKCLCFPRLIGRSECPYGEVEYVSGGKKHTKKYNRVHDEAWKHLKHNAIKRSMHDYIVKVGEGAVISLPSYCKVKVERGKINIDDSVLESSGDCVVAVTKNNLTPENIFRICQFTPGPFSRNSIEAYRKKVTPMFLYQFNGLFPGQYEEFIAKYPEYETVKPNWIGRTAKLSTCNKEALFTDRNRNVFHFDGETLVCDDYHSFGLPFDAYNSVLRLKVTENMKVKITDNEQVTETTEFVD